MGKIYKVTWGDSTFYSKWIIPTAECVICKNQVPEDEINVNGMCEKCQEIENNLLEKLAGKWADKVTEEEERRSFWAAFHDLEQEEENEEIKDWWVW